MGSVRRRRLLAAVKATLMAALAAATAAVPAHAEGAKVSLEAPSAIDVRPNLPPGQPRTTRLTIQVHKTAGPLANLRITFDTKDLNGVADADFRQISWAGRPCTTDDSRLSCNSLDGYNGVAIQPETLFLTVAAGAKGDDVGTLHVTAAVGDVELAAADITVRVQSDSDLRVSPIPAVHGIQPGTSQDPLIEFTNIGTIPTDKTVVELSTVYGLTPREQYSNCEYATVSDSQQSEDTMPGEQEVICTLGTEVQPGETYHLDPIRLAVGNDVSMTWMTATVLPAEDDTAAAWRSKYSFQRGTGKSLGAARIAQPAPDTGADPKLTNGSKFNVRTDRTAHLAWLDTWQPDTDGRSGTLSFTMRNDGPAALLATDHNFGLMSAVFAFNPSISIEKLPDGCLPSGGEASPSQHRCGFDRLMPPGYQKTITLRLDVPADLKDAELSAYTSGLSDKQNPTLPPPWELTPAQDDTRMLALGTEVNSLGSLGTASDSPSAPSIPGSTPTAAATPALAAPGSSGLGTTVGAGAAAVVLGGAVLTLINRRRKAGSHQ